GSVVATGSGQSPLRHSSPQKMPIQPIQREGAHSREAQREGTISYQQQQREAAARETIVRETTVTARESVASHGRDSLQQRLQRVGGLTLQREKERERQRDWQREAERETQQQREREILLARSVSAGRDSDVVVVEQHLGPQMLRPSSRQHSHPQPSSSSS